PMLSVNLLLMATAAGIILYKRPVVNLMSASPGKPYLQMSEREQFDFVATQEQRISGMMSDRPVKPNDLAVRVIKAYVDRYSANINRPPDASHENGSAVFLRAQPYIPLIARSFAARKVPIIIGIYLPVIESGYRECYENSNGAKGLFQFLPQT